MDKNARSRLIRYKRFPLYMPMKCVFGAFFQYCQTWEQRWSFAIPLEIIYLTPLQSWNPYNLKYWGHPRNDPLGKTPLINKHGKLTRYVFIFISLTFFKTFEQDEILSY